MLDAVLVEKVAARWIVLSEERSPPPASPVPVFIALEDETAVMPRENVAVFAL